MRKLFILAAALFIWGGDLIAQQDAMFTKYMFNSLSYNPAYAGARDFMYVGVLSRTQWVAVEGAPQTQTLTFHTPLKNERVGVGLNIVNDKIGPTNTLGINGSYAYRIPIGKGNLSIGLQGGIENYRADWSELDLESVTDPAFNLMPSRWLPNFGAGLHYQAERFFIGASVPHLVEYDLRENVDTDIYARQVRHFFFSTGAAFPINGDDLVFRPMALVKAVGLDKGLSKLEEFENIGAPAEFELDLSLLFQQTLWIGTSFRSSFAYFDDQKSSFDSADIWASLLLQNGLRLGAAYDFPLTELNQVTVGSFELFLGYEFNYRTKKMVTPRYF